MSAGLQLRLSQQLRLTPQLLQSIRLLQLSTVELQQEVESALLDNPLLERDDDPLATHLRLSASGAVIDPGPASAPAEGAPAPESGGGEDGPAAGEGDDAPGESVLTDWSAGGGRNDEDDEGPRDWAENLPSLDEHLLAQLGTTQATDRDRALVAMLIADLDERGYLTSPLEELLALFEADEQVEIEELETALRLLQSFDPAGVGARSPAECLRIQLDQALAHAPASERAELELARRIAASHLDLLAGRDYARMRRALGVDDEALRPACARILTLNPFPGGAFGNASPGYIVPDIRVRRVRGRWVAEINPEVRPRVRIHRQILEQLRQCAPPRRRAGARTTAREAGPLPGDVPAASVGEPVPAGLAPDAPVAPAATDWQAKARDASQFLRNLEDRFETIRRVAQAVVDRQSAFFSHGAIAMRPLVRREIAAQLDLNESTVSRATANKFLATPFGVYELRYFFASHVATDSGGEASSTAIRELISQLVAAEDARAPLPDGRIAQMLAEQGMVVARRTVAKYREQLRIAPANLRRRM